MSTHRNLECISHSPYLRSLQSKHSALQTIDFDVYQPLAECERICSHLNATKHTSDFDQIETELVQAKALFSFHWAMAECTQQGRFAERGRWQTRFADLTIDIALRACWWYVARKHAVLKRALQQHNQTMPGMFLLGLGKLGGGDLNYSSDTDLIAYFDPDILPVPSQLGQSYICHQVLQQLTKMLGQGGRSGFIWRVDWRLRPNASSTTLAMSTQAAIDYYFYRASPWHRLALMKARVIAGDIANGERFFNAITPFVWRQNLDYRALDELGEIKNRINLEHPSLRVERQRREPISDEIGGVDVKLGAGGIREIEFIVNALQLLWGGKHYELRTTNTLQALRILGNREVLPNQQVADLALAYQFLRRVENALQIRGNQQTHLIPENSSGREELLVLIEIADWQDLVTQINAHRKKVSEYFEALFAEQADVTGEPLLWPKEMSASAEAVVRNWEDGFIDYGVSREVRARLQPLLKSLAKALQSAPDPSDTAMRLHGFFRSLPQGEQYFRLLAESPKLLDAIIPPLLYSPPMSSLLKQSPHIIDCFMHADYFDPATDFEQRLIYDSEFVLQAQNYEVRLERIRRFVNEQLYQLYLQFLQGKVTPQSLQVDLYHLAIFTLDLCLRVVAEQQQLEQVPITVVGLGKMGVGRMAPQSDLDLIFVYDPELADIDVASNFVSRLQTAIGTPMREGVVYELDTRLRPSGRSGAPTVSTDSFKTHQLSKAHTWEHIALVSAQVICGDPSTKSAIEEIKQQVICSPRDPQQLALDAQKMWQRIAQHRVEQVEANIFATKLRPGGLMQAEYLGAVSVLQQGESLRDGYAEGHFYELLGMLNADLLSYINFWQQLQVWERLLDLQGQSFDAIPDVHRAAILDHFGINSVAELADRQQQISQQVENIANQIIAEIPENSSIENWVESAVRWV